MAKTSLENYIKNISKVPLLKNDEVIKLFKRVEDGDKIAFNKLVESNLRLVVSIAKYYNNPNIEIEDLISEGNIGLIKAIERFDYRRGFALSTYAVWWIKQAMMRHMTNKSRTIRLPAHVLSLCAKRIKTTQDYLEDNGEYPSHEQLRKSMGISKKMFNAIECGARKVESIHSPIFAAWLHNSSGTSSVDDNILDRIEDPDNVDPMDTITHSELVEVIRQSFKLLSKREEAIIRLRFGIADDPSDHNLWPITAKELAQMKKGAPLK